MEDTIERNVILLTRRNCISATRRDIARRRAGAEACSRGLQAGA